jgi:hypothetical protein
MKINEIIEVTAQELEAKKVEFGKKVLMEMKIAKKIQVSPKEYRINKASGDYFSEGAVQYRIEYPEFTHEQITSLYNLKNEIQEYDYLLNDSKPSQKLGKIYSDIGMVSSFLSIIGGILIGAEFGPVGLVVAVAGLLVSINYFAIADVLKTLKKISVNTAIKDKII